VVAAGAVPYAPGALVQAESAEGPGPLTRRELALAVGVALVVALFEFRTAAAGLGVYLVARQLGLGRPGAALAGVAFGGSGLVLFRPGLELGPRPGLFAVGMLLVAVALVSWWTRWSAVRLRWLGVLPVVAALLFVASLFGAPWLALAPEALGLPGLAHGYLGAGSFALRCGAFVALPAFVLALAAALSGGREGLAAAAFATFLLAVGGGGLACVPSAFLLALLAGYGLESSERPARVAALLITLGLLLWVTRVDAELLELPRVPGDPSDELVVWTVEPEGVLAGPRGLQLAGRVHPAVGASDLRVRLEPGGIVLPTVVARSTDGALRFTVDELDARGLGNGLGHLSLDVLGSDGERLGTRDTDQFVVRHPPRPASVTWLVLLGLGCTLLPRRLSWFVVILAGVQVAALLRATG